MLMRVCLRVGSGSTRVMGRFACLLALCLGGALGAAEGEAQERSPTVPALPEDVTAAKAYQTLERSCARCHQAGRLERPRPGANVANILALQEIAADPSLVRPGVPDASRIYNVALTRELHLDALNDASALQPSPDELQALRDWIAEVPSRARTAACEGRQPASPSSIVAAAERALAKLPPERARQTRFISLAHLYNACIGDRELAGFREALPRVVAGLAREDDKPPVDGWAVPVDDKALLFAVRLTAIGWRGERWNVLAAGYPLAASPALASPTLSRLTGAGVAILPADWFAAASLESDSDIRSAKPEPLLWGLPLPQALAHAWRRPADLTRVKADLGLSDADLPRLPGWEIFRSRTAAIQLRAGATALRRDLDDALPLLFKPTPQAAQQKSSPRFEIALSADKTRYKTGETASFSVVASRDCYLTLVGVDKGGRATVLFPNELAPDNSISAGKIIEVPAVSAHYRFRFKEKGRETVVAMCSETQKEPEGIAHDYDRLRFTVLGDWQLFLREPPQMKEARRDDAATDVPRPPARQRRRGKPGEPPGEPTVAAPDILTRTAITIDIE